MFGFFVKKNFCDVWDNLLHTIVCNLVMLVLLFGAFVLYFVTGTSADGVKSISAYIALVFSCVVISIFFFAEGDNAAKMANYETPRIKNFFTNIPSCLKDGTLFGLLIALLILVATTSIPYYFFMWIPQDGTKGSIFGLLVMASVFWFLLISALSLQWFVPIRSLMHNNFKKCLKKSYIIFFDNMFFSIGVAIVNLINLCIMIFTLGLLDGTTDMLVTNTNALRLRLYKYDWYEVNPGMTKEQRKDVPWEDLIAKDKRILGPRKFRSFIFPWKD